MAASSMGQAVGERAGVRVGRAGDPTAFEGQFGQIMRSLIDPTSPPALSRALAAGVFDEGAPDGDDSELDAEFACSLACHSDGVENFMTAGGRKVPKVDAGPAVDQRDAVPLPPPEGLTTQVGVADMEAARRFYDGLFGRAPDFVAAPDFQEYEVMPGVWFQITTLLQPGRMQRMRFGVADVAAGRRQLLDDGVRVGEVELLEGAAAWCDFADPFGNPLGLFQDLQRHPQIG